MITASDSYNTVDLGKYYAILPCGADYTLKVYCEKTAVKRVPPGFCYNSGTNEHFLSVDELRDLIGDRVLGGASAPVNLGDGTQSAELTKLETVG
jgi:hypothetical protein